MMGANNPPISIVLHAGAGESYRGDTESIPEFLRLLAADASERLLSGQSALEVVVYATSVLEDHPRFNAGKGASLNVEGKHELEAAVIDGTSGEYRAVAGVHRTKNPVRLAHALLRDDTIVFISGSGTDSLAAAHGLEMVDNSYFTVPEKSTYWRNNVHAHALMKVEHHGTVGAVALDKEGNLAAANSTGGTMFKAVGRIGDTAINGAGIYADPSIAVVCSGSGEAILKSRVASRVAEGFQRGLSLEKAAKLALLASADQDIESSCGVIALARDGNMTNVCNARSFAVANAQSPYQADAYIMQNSFTHLRQLTFYEDLECVVGYAKYPTMDGQAILELHHGWCMANLDQRTFRCIWKTLEQTVKALMILHKKTCCSCAALQDRIQIFPHSSSDSLEKGAPQHNLSLNQSESLSDQAWRCILSEKRRILGTSQPVDELHVEFDFLGMERVHLTVQEHKKTPTQFPRCAEFQKTYPGRASVEPGPRANNLPILKERTKLIVEMLRSDRSLAT